MPLVIRVSLRASHHRSEDCIWSQCETKTIARWMTAVNALQSLAMSTSAFKLLFDDDPYPELIQHAFHALFKKKKETLGKLLWISAMHLTILVSCSIRGWVVDDVLDIRTKTRQYWYAI